MSEKIREVKNNYKDVIISWEQKAVEWDFKTKYEQLGLVGYTKEKMLPITFYGKEYWINRENGGIYKAGEERKAGFDTAMSIYSLFFHSVEHPRNAGIWVPFRDVKRAAPFTEAFKRTVLQPFSATFEGRLEKLLMAGEKLGFERITHSDAGFQAMAFSCMPVQFLFWDGDEEFPAQANILFDSEITDYIHEETVVLIAGEGTKRLMGTAGVR